MKKLLFKLFPKFFTINKEYPVLEKGYSIAIVNPEEKSVIDVLGIQTKRVEELFKICVKSFENNSSYAVVLKECYAECKHPNELYFVTTVLDKLLSKTTNPLETLFSEIFK
jgi:hypothetical protein